MAEPLKNHYGPEVPKRIAAMIQQVHPDFPARAFLRDALAGYEELELMPRGRHIAVAMAKHLPADFPTAARILVGSMDAELTTTASFGMTSFLYLPHGYYIASHGLEHFDVGMAALNALTRRFTAEFAIRPFLDAHPDRALVTLDNWSTDENVHVRRLVSEGTRPRLPWAPRLKVFNIKRPDVLNLLSRLRDDPEEYVRRSVANHLNDIGKDDPDHLVKIARQWLVKAPPPRRRLVSHALRSLIKQGHPEALHALGFSAAPPPINIHGIRITPARVRIGGKIELTFSLTNAGPRPLPLMVDFRVHFIKSSGTSSPKVFKLKATTLAPGQSQDFSKRLSLAPMTTRTLYPGRHQIDVQINGNIFPLGAFSLMATARKDLTGPCEAQ